MPRGKRVTLTARVGGATASVEVPPTKDGEAVMVHVPFFKKDHPKHPSPANCE